MLIGKTANTNKIVVSLGRLVPEPKYTAFKARMLTIILSMLFICYCNYIYLGIIILRKVWRFRNSKNRQHNGLKKKKQKDKQWCTKKNTTQKTKDWTTRNPLITGDELGYTRRLGKYCHTWDIRLVTLVTNPMINLEWGKDRILILVLL